MSIEVKVPVLPESVQDATIAAWRKQTGENVHRDEVLLELETDKVVLEVPAPADGVLSEICFQVGDVVTANQVLARLTEGLKASKEEKQDDKKEKDTEDSATSPAVRRMLREHHLKSEDVPHESGRLTVEDIKAHISNQNKKEQKPSSSTAEKPSKAIILGEREERRVPMTRLRARIAERLVSAQHEAAMLTTFNEVNLKKVMDLRAEYQDLFVKKHGVKLGFMSFFTRAVVEALRLFPAINASIDGQDIVYHGYYDIGIAVSTDRGLVVPVLRDAGNMRLHEIEKQIGDMATRARDGKIALEEIQGGTFTITNGGVFGSLLATPIINPPQSGILGMHKIQDRPIVENGEIVIRPMMYLALSYDHRLVDGKESVQFLVAIKSFLEDPARLLLNV